jgi:hypothetical protein
MPGALAWEKMVGVLAQMRATGANTSLHTSGGRANEVEPWSVDAPGLAVVTPGTSRELSFSSSREATLDDVLSFPGFFDIVVLGNRELGLLGYPCVPPLPACLPTIEGDIVHGGSGCSTTGTGQS